MNGKELKASKKLDLERQADACMQYLSKFDQSEQRTELVKWVDGKDFEPTDAVEIMLILLIDRKVII